MDLNRRIYCGESFDYIQKMSGKLDSLGNPTKVNYIDECSKFFGVSASAIAGALIEEADSYYTGGGLLDAQLDVQTMIQTHEVLEEHYNDVINQNMIDDKTPVNTFMNYAMRDIGPCNIRVAVAIRAVFEYFAEFPSNPLKLSEDYKTNYSLIVGAIVTKEGSKLTAVVAAMELKKAQDYFEKNVDKDYWAILPQETRDALIITAYNNGLVSIEKGRQSALKAFNTYKPIPGGGESGGLDHEYNAESIAKIVGQENYGDRFSISLLDMDSGTVISKAMQDDEEGKAYRYALTNQNRAAILGIDYSSLDVAKNDFSQKYWQDRLNMLKALSSYAGSTRIDRVVLDPNDTRYSYYFDQHNSLGIALNGPSAETDPDKVNFGTDKKDTVIGRTGNDRLYGGEGNDTLIGNSGDDYLEGNSGHDSLDGGSGDDEYRVDKDDIIRDDEKGEGVVYLDDKLLSVAYKEGDVEGVYKDKQGNIYKQDGNDLIINNGLKIENFFLSLNGKKIPDGYKYLSITLKEKSEEEEGDESNEDGAPSFDKAENIRSPIVLDLNNNGIETKNMVKVLISTTMAMGSEKAPLGSRVEMAY